MTRFPFASLLTFITALSLPTIMCQAEDTVPRLTVGTQEISLSAGYLLPHRLTTDHTTKQSGPAIMPSWDMVVTDPIGSGHWYGGQLLLGAEIVYIQFQHP